MKTVENDWQYLSNPVKTILERIDINQSSVKHSIGTMVEIPYFHGVLTQDIAEEIVKYSESKDNKGYFSASITDGILNITFIKQAF